MGLVVVNREWEDEQGRVLNQYIANVLDSRFARITVQTDYTVNIAGGVTLTKTDNFFELPIGQSWESYGIIEGCTVSGTFGGNTVVLGTTVTHVENNFMVLSVNQTGANGIYTSGAISFDIVPESFELFTNYVLSSSNPGDEFSLIDGNPNRFVADGISALTVGGASIAFSQLGNQSGGFNVFPTIQRVADVNGHRNYQINIPNDRLPLYLNSELFEFGDCLKPWYRFSAISQTANPSVRISTVSTFSLGNTGFFNEVFNGGVPDYSVTSAVFKIGGVAVDTFDHNQPTDFEIRVDGVFDASSKFGIAFFRQASDEETQNVPNAINFNTSLSIGDNLSVGTPADIIGFLNPNGAKVDITDIEITEFGTYATIKGTLTPNGAYSSYINGNDVSRLFRLAVKLEDYTLSGNLIRPVWLSVFYEDSAKYFPPLGPWLDAFGFTLFDHDNESIPYVLGTVGGIPAQLVPKNLFTEDNANLQFKLRIPRPTQQEIDERFFTGITLNVIVRKFDGTSFVLESYDSNFGAILTGDDTMVVDSFQARGFKLPPTSVNNEIRVSRASAIDTGTHFGIQVDYGFLVNWQYWLAQTNADIVFFPNQNKDWYHYQNEDGAQWGVWVEFLLHTSDGDYENKANINHYDYDTFAGVAGGTSVISYHLVDGTPITMPLADQVTMVRATHTAPSGFIMDALRTWGEITVEPKENAPRWLTSSVYDNGSVTGNPFQPLAGQTKCKLTIAGSVAILETLIDPTVLNLSNGLKFTSEISSEVRKGSDIERFKNRTKDETDTVKTPKTFESDDRAEFDCCEKRKVIGDLTSTEPKKNDVTGHWMAGESVTFKLFDHDGDTGYVIDSLPFAQQANMWYCQLNWREILGLYGSGCYRLVTEVDYAGLTETLTIENYQLLPYSIESTVNDVRVTSVYNAYDLKNGVIFNGTNVIDSIRVDGQFNYSQPNLNVRNYTKTSFEQNKITRQQRETFELRTGQLTDKFVKLLKYALQHENYLLITDYCLINPRYDLIDTAVILTETPQLNYVDTGSRTISVTAKFEEKILNNISTFSNDNPQAQPISITFANGGFATVINSDGSFEVTFDSTAPYELPDYTVNVLRNGVLVSTSTFPTLEPITDINITI